ncbi:acetyltransferase [Anopheles sinensis]|uniref:Acetyltransferase n=1 Tax=Anopheles sinensis TaxID=74873 RepID=A0A084VHG2_ANOSI|nr:acetyltransferase [Anopheles sinensis]
MVQRTRREEDTLLDIARCAKRLRKSDPFQCSSFGQLARHARGDDGGKGKKKMLTPNVKRIKRQWSEPEGHRRLPTCYVLIMIDIFLRSHRTVEWCVTGFTLDKGRTLTDSKRTLTRARFYQFDFGTRKKERQARAVEGYFLMYCNGLYAIHRVSKSNGCRTSGDSFPCHLMVQHNRKERIPIPGEA